MDIKFNGKTTIRLWTWDSVYSNFITLPFRTKILRLSGKASKIEGRIINEIEFLIVMFCMYSRLKFYLTKKRGCR